MSGAFWDDLAEDMKDPEFAAEYAKEWLRITSDEAHPPEPCQYCSVMADELKECDRSCDSLTKEHWSALTGEDE